MEGLPEAAGMNLSEYNEAKQTVEDFLSRGNHLVEVGSYSDALLVFTHALSIYPNHVHCYIARGYVHQEMGNYEKAVEDQWRAVELDRKNPVARKYLSIALTALSRKMLMAGKISEAQKLLTRSIHVYPENTDAREILRNIELNFSTMGDQVVDEKIRAQDAGQNEQIFIVPKLEASVPPENRVPGTVLLPCPWSPGDQNSRMSEHELPQWFNRSPSKQASNAFDTSMAEFMSKFDDLESLWMRSEVVPPGFEQLRSDSGYSTMDDQVRQQQWKQPKFYHHKGESSFKEVVPRPSSGVATSVTHRGSYGPLAPLTVTMRSGEESRPSEDLLISPKTHFKPIQDEMFNDGTTFSAPTTIEDPVEFVRDASGAFLTLTADSGSNCGSPKKYMVYRRSKGEQWVEHRQAEDDDDEETDEANLARGGTVEDVEPSQMTFCKKNGPGQNFVPKFKVHCSKREKTCQTDERDVMHAKVSNEQFINDMFVGAPRSGHGFPAHFNQSPPSHAEKIQQCHFRGMYATTVIRDTRDNKTEEIMYATTVIRDRYSSWEDDDSKNRAAPQAMVFPLEMDDARREDDDEELLLHDIHVLRELELKGDDVNEEEEAEDSGLTDVVAARSFDNANDQSWEQSPQDGFYPIYSEEDGYGVGHYGESVPVEYLDSDLYDAMFGLDASRPELFLSSSLGSKVRKRNHSGADSSFRKQRFRGSNWAPWQRRPGSNTSTPLFKERPCSFFLEGSCKKEHDCKFSHDLASIACRFFEEGSCLKGELCPFRHGPAPETPPGSYQFGSSPGSSLSAQFQQWRAQQKFDSKAYDGSARSLNDQRRKYYAARNASGKRQRHGSAAAAVQREASYVLCSESDFPALSASGKDDGRSPNDTVQVTCSSNGRRARQKKKQKSGGQDNRDVVCKFLSGSRQHPLQQAMQQQQQTSPDAFLDLDAALLSLIMDPETEGEDGAGGIQSSTFYGSGFTATAAAAGVSI
ncbi:unnamed protein product [Notodromas monacha]|uniref:RING-type E3 ubiquitin transferase n=1 Tax=Notodromas monacha TaxID=399045 RepID=A0A7R9BF28_9CRUS|nr:unnamed protein product [Notodromas monacha]CAG0914131.1 unnamed protein product [Notodromas monacha]